MRGDARARTGAVLECGAAAAAIDENSFFNHYGLRRKSASSFVFRSSVGPTPVTGNPDRSVGKRVHSTGKRARLRLVSVSKRRNSLA